MRESAARSALFFLLLEGNLLLSLLFYPDFRENMPVWAKIAPLQAVKELLETIEDAGFSAYLVAQQFFKAANSLGTAAAALFATGAVAREVENRTIEFLLSRPWSRRRILASKFLAGALALAVPIFVSSASAILLVRVIPDIGERVPPGPILLASVHCSLFLVAIYAVTFLGSTLSSDANRMAFVVLGVSTLSFALYLVNGVTHYSFYRFSDVPTYLRILREGRLPVGIELGLLGTIGALYLAADRIFTRRDF
ncbi:MAG TPA: ABC transporter permease [Planctomycetota bacterium]|nr:ABC transporter permease [Planctomycetota bacterium]